MKNTILFSLIFILILIGCKKDGTGVKLGQPLADEIIFKQLSKTITISQKDSISGVCQELMFEITLNHPIEYDAVLSYNNEGICCDGFNSILTNPQTEAAVALDENIKISEDNHWYSGELNLDHFAGLGEKYLGYRACFFPDGVMKYIYGWIKIELTSNGDTLKILSRAKNNTIYNPIKAGQIE